MTRVIKLPRADFRTEWMIRSLCTEAPALPWTEDHRVPTLESDLMRFLCQECPVSLQCTVFTRDAQINAGFWAGASRNRYDEPGPAA